MQRLFFFSPQRLSPPQRTEQHLVSALGGGQNKTKKTNYYYQFLCDDDHGAICSYILRQLPNRNRARHRTRLVMSSECARLDACRSQRGKDMYPFKLFYQQQRQHLNAICISTRSIDIVWVCVVCELESVSMNGKMGAADRNTFVTTTSITKQRGKD